MIERSFTELLNEIQAIPEETLIERILSWCDENSEDPMEIGEMFSNNKHIKEVIYIDAVQHNQIQDLYVKKKLHETKDLDEW